MMYFTALMSSSAARLGLGMVSIVLMLSGCSVLPEREALQFYRLPVHEAFTQKPETATQVPVSSMPSVLRILTPYANRAVAGSRILVIPETDRVSSYKGARWSDAAPVLLRDRLIEVFRASGQFRSVVTGSGNLGADLELSSELYGFHVVYESGSPVAVVVLDATLADPAESRILASKRFRVHQAVQGKEVPEVVQAFGIAVDSLAEQLLVWSRQQAGGLSVR